MRRRQDYIRLEADALCHIARERPDERLRHIELAENLRRQAQHLHELEVPILRLGVDELRRRRICVLVHRHARQAVVEVFRDHQEAFRALQ